MHDGDWLLFLFAGSMRAALRCGDHSEGPNPRQLPSSLIRRPRRPAGAQHAEGAIPVGLVRGESWWVLELLRKECLLNCLPFSMSRCPHSHSHDDFFLFFLPLIGIYIMCFFQFPRLMKYHRVLVRSDFSTASVQKVGDNSPCVPTERQADKRWLLFSPCLKYLSMSSFSRTRTEKCACTCIRTDER